MTLELLLKLLRSHLAALQSTAWQRPHGPSNGPALFLDEEDTRALIAQLADMLRREETARALAELETARLLTHADRADDR